MPSSNQPEIYVLVGELRERTKRSFEVVRGLMADYLGIDEYDRSTFYNKFRRKDRNPHYELDEMLALVSAFTAGIQKEADRCTAEEAFRLFGYAAMPLDGFARLKEFFDDNEFEEASRQYLEEHDLVHHPQDLDSPRRVFISYSKRDRLMANRLRAALNRAGQAVWQDIDAIPGGNEWIDAIERGINGSFAFVVIVSAHAAASYWVREEILHAQRRGKTIIPFCIDTTLLPLGIQQLNCVEAHPDVDAGIRKLLAALEPYRVTDSEPDESRRQLELDYLDRVLLEQGVWRTLYTPMAGSSQELRTQESDSAVETPPAFMLLLEDFDQFLGEALSKARVQSYPKDILRAFDDDKQQLVILGDSGSGKSTTLRRLAADLADTARRLPERPLPVLLELGKLEKVQPLEDCIKDHLHALAPWYADLHQEGRLALLLDGLNEIPAGLRETLLNDIRTEARSATSENHFLVVTCRTHDYTHDLDVNIARRLLIKPLDPIRIRRFIETYVQDPVEKRDELFWTLAGDEALRFWKRFVRDLGDEFGGLLAERSAS